MDPIEHRKYFLADLNSPAKGTAGFTNQMWALVNAIMLSHHHNRDLIVSGFFPNYNSKCTADLFQVIDRRRLEELLKSHHIKIKIYTTLDKQVDVKKFNFLPFRGKESHLLSTKLANVDIYLGFTFSMYIRNAKTSISTLSHQIISNISFHDNIISQVNYYKKEMGLNKYCAIHLRLEDDYLAYFSKYKRVSSHKLAEELIKEYKNEIRKLIDKTEKIYVATGLIKYPNSYNKFLLELKEEYPNLVYRTTAHKFPNHLKHLQGREVEAIIDYLLCLDASKFLGILHSTFSPIIVNIFKEKCKPYSYVKINGLPT